MTDAVKHKLEFASLNKQFTSRGSSVEVLRDIDFAVREGEFLSIVGASGCGKTTLLRIIDGLETFDSGQMLIDGQPSSTPGPDRGFVFQQDNLLPWRTIAANVRLGLELQGVPRREAEREVSRYLEVVGLAGFAKHYPHELSGGMRQRANLARGFCIAPDILLMDEPFAALDAQTREIMQSELLRIWGITKRNTVVFITHQIDEAIYLSDRVLVLTARPGRVKEVIDVPFERPRDLHLKRRPEFAALNDHIWSLIEEEVRAAMAITDGS